MDILLSNAWNEPIPELVEFGWRYFRVLFADCIPVLLNDFYVRPST